VSEGYDVLANARLAVEYDPRSLSLAGLLDQVEAFQRRYVVLTDAQHAVVAVWNAHAHAIAATSTTPYLHVVSAELESGKTRLLEVIEPLVPSPMSVASMSTAVLYRAVDKLAPTLLLDEVDNQLKDKTEKAELIGLLNAGYRRGAKAYRIGGARRDELEAFETFSAKAIAGLSDLVAALASRCLRIEMRRRSASEPVEDFFREEAHAAAAPINEALAAWAEDAVPRLQEARPVRLGLRDRLEEACRLLVAIADEAGPEWSRRIREGLREVATSSADGAESLRVRLLRDVREVFEGHDELPTREILLALFGIEDAPWIEDWADPRSDADTPTPSRGAAMKLARMLKPVGVRPRDLWIDGKTRKGYRRGDFEDAFSRYLPSEVARSREPFIHAANSSDEVARDENRLATSESVNPARTDASRDLATTPGGLGGNGRPGLGDDGFLELLEAAFDAGHITATEATERLHLHKLVVRSREAA
jgi:Protein of unknown function (DUF3631)